MSARRSEPDWQWKDRNVWRGKGSFMSEIPKLKPQIPPISQILRELSRMSLQIFSRQKLRALIIVTYCIRVIYGIRS